MKIVIIGYFGVGKLILVEKLFYYYFILKFYMDIF